MKRVKLSNIFFYATIITLLSACGGGGDGGGDNIPDAPASGLQAVAGDTRVTVTWDPVAGADSYNLYWSTTTGTGNAGTQVADVSTPFYHDNVTNGMDYYYVVTAVNYVGESAPSAEVSATPADISISSLTFADENLGICVNATGANNVNELSTLNCPSQNIYDLSGIENLTSLDSLDLNSNSVSDITPLSGLTNLTDLTLFNNNINVVTPLAGLTNLITLYLDDNNFFGGGGAHVDALVTLTSATLISLVNNLIYCSQLDILINTLGSPPVDRDGNPETSDTIYSGGGCKTGGILGS